MFLCHLEEHHAARFGFAGCVRGLFGELVCALVSGDALMRGNVDEFVGPLEVG